MYQKLILSGLLTKTDGRPVEDGTYSVIFRFFNSFGDYLLWEEQQNILVKDGIISATLGLIDPIDNPLDFSSEESYLEIVVENVPLSPRQALTSVLYSMKSDTANYSQETIQTLIIYQIYRFTRLKIHFQIFRF